MTDSGSQLKASWPAEHRAALSIVVNVGAQFHNPDSSGFDVGIDYTADGLTRLLAMFEDLDIAVTTAWSSAALSTFPQMARSAQDRGHELALSTVDSAGTSSGPVDPAGRISDLPIVGLLANLPLSTSPHDTSRDDETIAAPRWLIDGSGGDVPRLQPASVSSSATADAAPTVILPVAPYWIDRQWWQPDRPSPPSLLLESWSAGLASVRTFGGLMTIILHPHLSGRPGHAETIVRFVDEAIASADVWIARADQIASWWTETTETRQS